MGDGREAAAAIGFAALLLAFLVFSEGTAFECRTGETCSAEDRATVSGGVGSLGDGDNDGDVNGEESALLAGAGGGGGADVGSPVGADVAFAGTSPDAEALVAEGRSLICPTSTDRLSGDDGREPQD